MFMWAIDTDSSDPFVELKKDILVGFEGLPLNFFRHTVYNSNERLFQNLTKIKDMFHNPSMRLPRLLFKEWRV